MQTELVNGASTAEVRRHDSANALKRRPAEERWRPTGFGGMELLVGRNTRQEYPRHWHEEIYLAATLSGVSHSDCKSTTLRADCGKLALIAPGEIHSNWKSECTFRCVLIEVGALREKVEHYAERTIPAVNFRSEMIEDQGVIHAFLRMHRSMEGEVSEVGRDDRAIAFFLELVVRYSQTALPEPESGNEDAAVRRAKRLLEDRYPEVLPLGELARAVGLSACHLNRSFRKRVGMPPHEYQLQLRIMRAKELLRAGRAISETAALVGFVDQSHLTKHFKRTAGVTPGQYLR